MPYRIGLQQVTSPLGQLKFIAYELSGIGLPVEGVSDDATSGCISVTPELFIRIDWLLLAGGCCSVMPQAEKPGVSPISSFPRQNQACISHGWGESD
jgi:hypothetical protein